MAPKTPTPATEHQQSDHVIETAAAVLKAKIQELKQGIRVSYEESMERQRAECEAAIARIEQVGQQCLQALQETITATPAPEEGEKVPYVQMWQLIAESKRIGNNVKALAAKMSMLPMGTPIMEKDLEEVWKATTTNTWTFNSSVQGLGKQLEKHGYALVRHYDENDRRRTLAYSVGEGILAKKTLST